MKIGALEPIAALNRVKIRETGEPLVDIRDFCPAVLTPDTVCPFLRRTAAEMLNHAASLLPPQHQFRIGTALRTLSMQKRGWDGYFQRMTEEHPGWPLSALRRATNRYFAPYDQPAPPGHCTGGAVDVALLGPDGAPLDVTAPTKGWEAAYTWSDKLSPEAKRNRMIMVEAMLAAGFSNCREEYWHYSWGDSAWAVRVGEKTCPYGFVETAPTVEAHFMGALAAEIRQEAPLEWTCRTVALDDGTPGLFVGVFWAEDREVTLNIEAPAPEALFISADRKEWKPLSFDHLNNTACVRLIPDRQQVFLVSHPLQS